MEVYRISKKIHADKLSSSGAKGRWNLEHEHVLYTGSSRSLATLELVVRRNSIMPAFVYKLMVISIPADEDFYTDVYLKDLPKNWRSIGAYPTLQEIGSNWYKMKKSLILEVPSAIINQERNYIINTKHPDFKKNIKLVRTEDYFWDSRLL